MVKGHVRPLDQFAKQHLLVMREISEADPLWGQKAYVYESGHGIIYMGDRCGTFLASPRLRDSLFGWGEEAKAILTTWILEQNRGGERFPRLTPDVLLSVSQRQPLRFSTKIDRLFMYLNDRGDRLGDPIFLSTGLETEDNLAAKCNLMRWIEAVNEKEMMGFVRAVASAGYLEERNNNWWPTAEGLLRLESMDKPGAANDQAFVAMWFGAEMDDPYKLGIEPGLADVGYRAFRIDQKEHANKIDDEIIAEIRRSRFVVADFTCGTVLADGQSHALPRGGVYYEAGFAMGLNMPVIWTVREDQIGLVHFDTRQFNHITWRDPDDLRQKLTRRVAAMFGHFRAN